MSVGCVVERGARARVEQVDRHLARFELGELEREVDALLERLAHAEDAAAAQLHARVAGEARRADPVVVAVRRADRREQLAARFEVVVVAAHARGREPIRLFGSSSSPSEHATSRPVSRCTAPTASITRRSSRSSGPRTATTMQNWVAPASRVRVRGREDLVDVEERIDVDARVVADRLRAERAVFRARARLGVDEALELHFGSAPRQPDLVRERDERRQLVEGEARPRASASARVRCRRSSSRARSAVWSSAGWSDMARQPILRALRGNESWGSSAAGREKSRRRRHDRCRDRGGGPRRPDRGAPVARGRVRRARARSARTRRRPRAEPHPPGWGHGRARRRVDRTGPAPRAHVDLRARTRDVSRPTPTASTCSISPGAAVASPARCRPCRSSRCRPRAVAAALRTDGEAGAAWRCPGPRPTRPSGTGRRSRPGSTATPARRRPASAGTGTRTRCSRPSPRTSRSCTPVRNPFGRRVAHGRGRARRRRSRTASSAGRPRSRPAWPSSSSMRSSPARRCAASNRTSAVSCSRATRAASTRGG